MLKQYKDLKVGDVISVGACALRARVTRSHATSVASDLGCDWSWEAAVLDRERLSYSSFAKSTATVEVLECAI